MAQLSPRVYGSKAKDTAEALGIQTEAIPEQDVNSYAVSDRSQPKAPRADPAAF